MSEFSPEQELHYFRSILGNLRELRSLLSLEEVSAVGQEVLADNIDWLDCYIDVKARAAIDKELGKT